MYKNLSGIRLPYIRPSKRTDLMLDAHLFVGHGGTKKTFEYLAKQYFWENMYVDVHDCVYAAWSALRNGLLNLRLNTGIYFRLCFPHHFY